VFVMDQLTTQKMVALRHFANYWAIRLLNSLGAVFIRTMLGRWIYCADRLLSCQILKSVHASHHGHTPLYSPHHLGDFWVLSPWKNWHQACQLPSWTPDAASYWKSSLDTRGESASPVPEMGPRVWSRVLSHPGDEGDDCAQYRPGRQGPTRQTEWYLFVAPGDACWPACERRVTYGAYGE